MRALLFAACMAVMCGAAGLTYWATCLRTPNPPRPSTKGVR